MFKITLNPRGNNSKWIFAREQPSQTKMNACFKHFKATILMSVLFVWKSNIVAQPMPKLKFNSKKPVEIEERIIENHLRTFFPPGMTFRNLDLQRRKTTPSACNSKHCDHGTIHGAPIPMNSEKDASEDAQTNGFDKGGKTDVFIDATTALTAGGTKDAVADSTAATFTKTHTNISESFTNNTSVFATPTMTITPSPISIQHKNPSTSTFVTSSSEPSSITTSYHPTVTKLHPTRWSNTSMHYGPGTMTSYTPSNAFSNNTTTHYAPGATPPRRKKPKRIHCVCEGEEIWRRLMDADKVFQILDRKRKPFFQICTKEQKLRGHIPCNGKCFKIRFRAKRWRPDMKCDAEDKSGNFECDPDGLFPCCSAHGWCGDSDGHCNCHGCKDYRRIGNVVRGCLRNPVARKKRTGCTVDNRWTEHCFCNSNRCNGGKLLTSFETLAGCMQLFTLLLMFCLCH